MFPTSIRRAFATPAPSFNAHTNPYKAKRIWPPDFTKLSAKHQFRLERRYRRRAKLKWARPRWTKAVKLAQLGSAVFILTYGVLFMDWGREDTPFRGIRQWFNKKTDSIWTSNASQPRQSSLGSYPTTPPSPTAPPQLQGQR